MSRYIDAETLLKSAVSKFKCVPVVGVTTYRNGEECFDVEDFEEFINEHPTADVVEVRHGHWVEHIEKPSWLEDDVEVFYNCSECGTSHWSISPPYCPNCGAKMDGERSENGKS